VKSRAASEASLLDAPARVLAAPDAAAAISAPLRARVVKVQVRAGQTVDRGQALVDVMMPELVQAAGSFSAATLKAAAYAKRKAQLELLKADGLVRSAELADVDASLATMRADAQAARATLRAAGLTDQQAEGLLTSDGTVSLRAPIAGMVTAVDTIAGEVREAGGRPLVELAGQGKSQVEARLQGDFIEGGEFELLTASGVRVSLAPISVSPRVEARDGTRLAWFTVDPEASLLPGAQGRVRVLSRATWRAVPAAAVVGIGEDAQVITRKANRAVPVPVKVIAISGAEAIVDGLAAELEVAAEGQRILLGAK